MSQVNTLYYNKYVKLYDMINEGDKHYLNASRREVDDLPAVQPSDVQKTMLPDAVSCFVIIDVDGEEPRLLLNWEYRYPAGQYLLSVPAGLIDPEDKKSDNPLVRTAIRELGEECGLQVLPTDEIKELNPFVWSSPGMSDESNALVAVTVHRDKMPSLNQDGAEGTEMFDGFQLVTKAEARKIIQDGRDPRGGYYPLYTWAALMYFLSA